MKVGIQRDDDPIGRSRMLQDVRIRRSGHPDLAHMRTFDAGGAELFGRITREALNQIERESSESPSRSRRFDHAVFEIDRCERQRLLNVFRFQFRVVAEELVTIRVCSNRFNDAPDRQPHTANARLPVHLVGVPRNPIKLPYQ